MALTKKDIQAIREVVKQVVKQEVQPQFDAVYQKMDEGFKGVYTAMQGMKIYMETRFRELENTMEHKHNNHEIRIQNIEEKLEITST